MSEFCSNQYVNKKLFNLKKKKKTPNLLQQGGSRGDILALKMRTFLLYTLNNLTHSYSGKKSIKTLAVIRWQ